MSAARSLASRLLRAVLRYAPAESKEWASAMLRELDFIESDWAALFWAIGSTTAIFRHTGRGLGAWLLKHLGFEEVLTMKDIGKIIGGILLGALLATLLAFGNFGLHLLSFHFFPSLGATRLPWVAWLTVFVVPEIIFVVGIVALWRKRKPMAIGILLAALMLGTHFAMHVAKHWNG